MYGSVWDYFINISIFCPLQKKSMGNCQFILRKNARLFWCIVYFFWRRLSYWFRIKLIFDQVLSDLSSKIPTFIDKTLKSSKFSFFNNLNMTVLNKTSQLHSFWLLYTTDLRNTFRHSWTFALPVFEVSLFEKSDTINSFHSKIFRPVR